MDETNPITQIDFMQAHIETLKEQLAEKDAMIDWLVKKLVDNGFLKDCGAVLVCEKADIETSRRLNKCYQEYLWYKAAQEAVRKYD